MRLLIFLTIISLLTNSMLLIAQDSIIKTPKVVVNLNLGGNGNYSQSYSDGVLEFCLMPKVQYFIKDNISLIAGGIWDNTHSWGMPEKIKRNYIAFSPAARCYLFKKKWVFLEGGYNFGKLSGTDIATSKINNASIGLGFNFLMAYHPGIGRFAFELYYRYSFFKSENYLNKLVGTGIGIHYLYSQTGPKNRTLDGMDKSINSMHIFEISKNFNLKYSYEKAISNAVALKYSLKTNSIMNFLADSARVSLNAGFEPRWYYGYTKRMQRGQIVTNNSSDFVAANLSLEQMFQLKSDQKATLLSITPQWGFRRAIGKKLIFETTLGYSFSLVYYKNQFLYDHLPYFNMGFGYVF